MAQKGRTSWDTAFRWWRGTEGNRWCSTWWLSPPLRWDQSQEDRPQLKEVRHCSAAQSFGFSLGGPGYSLNYNSGGYYGGYGYYGRPSYYGYPSSYYGYPSTYSIPRPYYGRPTYYGRPSYRSSYRSYRGYRR